MAATPREKILARRKRLEAKQNKIKAFQEKLRLKEKRLAAMIQGSVTYFPWNEFNSTKPRVACSNHAERAFK